MMYSPEVYRSMSDQALLDELVTHALGVGALDDDTPLWRELARRTKRDPDTGNRLSEEAS